MAQTVTNSGLGTPSTPMHPGSYGPKESAAMGQGGESVYVNSVNGNLILRQSDGFLVDSGFGFDLFQTYNSRGAHGSSWCFNVNSRLKFYGEANQVGSYVIRIGEDGHQTRFTWDATAKAYRSEEGGVATLKKTAEGWVYQQGSDKNSLIYDEQGYLYKIRDKDGHYLLFNYDDSHQLKSITNQNKTQSVTWTFNNGLLQDVITQSKGKTIHALHYEYDALNRLSKVSRDLDAGKAYWICYDYVGDTDLISDVRQSDGTKLHIDYDAEGRVRQLTDGEGRTTCYIYDKGKTTVTNALDESWIYTYDDLGRLKQIDGPENYRICYDYEGAELSTIRQGNQIWRFLYNEAGDCIYREEPNGHITHFVYDEAHHLLCETQYQDFDTEHRPIHPKNTRYIYDTKGHLLFLIEADGTVTEYRYDAEGLCSSSRTYLRESYPIKSLDELILLSEATLRQWAATQSAQEVRLIDYLYDWRGQLQEEIQYTSVNAEGIGLNAHAKRTQTVYDAAGRLVQKSVHTEKGWCITSYYYDDLGRLTLTTDNQGHQQKIEYDDALNRVVQTDENGLQTISLYDQSGLLLSRQRLDNKQTYGSTKYQYDNAGRLIAETDAAGHSIYWFYDAQGRLQAKVNAQGGMTEYQYNAEGFVVQTHDYAQRINTQNWLKNHPVFSEIKPETTKNDQIFFTIYNQYNQVAYALNSEGAVIGYTYDAQGNVLCKTAYATRFTGIPSEVTWEQLPVTSNKKEDRSIHYYYDIQGRLQAEVNAGGYACEYRYNHLGLLIETIRYNTKVQESLCGTWALDRPKVNLKKDLHTYLLYDAQGRKTADIDGEGYLVEYSYNEQGLLQERIAYEHAVNIQLITDAITIASLRPDVGTNNRKTTYVYNDLGQLDTEHQYTGLLITYVYDEMGQLILKRCTDEKTQTTREQSMRYDALGRLVQQLDELGSAKLNAASLSPAEIKAIWEQHSIRYTYDEVGLLLSKTDALGRTQRYFYNEYQQVQFTVSDTGAVIETRYNALNQIESTHRYSTFLKGSWKTLTTKDLIQRVQSLKNEHLDEVITYEYNSIGQVIAKHNGARGLLTSEYNVFGELALNTEAIDVERFKSTSYTYDRRGLLTGTTDDAHGLKRIRSFEYDAFGWVSAEADGPLNKTTYTLNHRGERIKLKNAKDNIKAISYDAFGRVLQETNYASKDIKIYDYDDSKNQLTVTNPLNNGQIITQFNAFGDKITLIDARQNKTTFSYDERGLLIRVDSPENTYKAYHYDDLGQLSWEENAAGYKIAYTYDAQGHLLTKTLDPEGLKQVTSYQYDGLGRQLQIKEANGCIKEFTYDTQGNLIRSCIDANGLNLVTEFAYDARGLLTRQTEVNSHGASKVTAYEWDNLGRRTAVISAPDTLNYRTEYTYDEQDNMVCVKDARGHSTHYIYDELNQCRYEVDARGVVTEHVYSLNGKEIQRVKYANRIDSLSSYTEVELKNALKKNVQKDYYEFSAFDDAGHLIWTYDALGHPTRYEYDNNDNVIGIYRYACPISLEQLKKGSRPKPDVKEERAQYFIYDGLDQVRFQCDTLGTVTESQYDANGQVIRKTQYFQRIELKDTTSYSIEYFQTHLISDAARDKTTRYVYDKVGRLSLEVSPQGRVTSYQYDALNQIISCTRYATPITLSMNPEQVTSTVYDRTNYFIYDVAGRECYRISAEGRVIERTYDETGNVLSQITHQKNVSAGHYTLTNIAELLKEDTAARTTNYQYDDLGHLQTEINAEGTRTKYEYDSNGNVMTKKIIKAANSRLDKNQEEAGAIIWRYSYDEVNQQTEIYSPKVSVMQNNKAVSRCIKTIKEYDSFGNLIKEVRDSEGLKQTKRYEYDVMNRRIKTIYPDVRVNNAKGTASATRQEEVRELTEEVRYNAFGEMIASRDRAEHWKHFAYNTEGNLLYSIDTQGGLTEYSYDSFGRVTCKTLRYSAVVLKEYTTETIHAAIIDTTQDRHEWYVYNQDDELIERTRDRVRTYDPSTKSYTLSAPCTQITYTAFGEVSRTQVLINSGTWSTTQTYYDKDGHQKATLDAEGYMTLYTLNEFGETASTTEYATRATSWDEQTYTVPISNTKDRTVEFTYDALGQLTSKSLINVSYYFIDKQNKNTLVKKTGPVNTEYRYDALGNLVYTKDAQGNIAYCYYDDLGQLIAKVGPQIKAGRAATTYYYDGLGNLAQTHQWLNGAETDTISEDGYTLNKASTRDVITSSSWSVDGQLLSETDGMNHTLYYSYDANGNIARSFQTLTRLDKDALVQEKRYSYDSENRLVRTATFKDGINLHYEDLRYTIFGEVSDKGFNDQYNVHVAYDRLGRAWRSNLQGYYQIFLYDLADHVTQIVTASNAHHEQDGDKGIDLSNPEMNLHEEALNLNQGQWISRLQRQDNEYDALGRLLCQTREYMGYSSGHDHVWGLLSASQVQKVDRWGNMLSYKNALGHETTYEYTDFNEVCQQEHPEVTYMDEHGATHQVKPVTIYYYDILGRAIGMKDANDHVVLKEYDALGNITAEIDAKQNSRTKEYNLLNQLTKTINERGVMIAYTYDNANRLVCIYNSRDPNKSSQHYLYDEAGQLLQQTTEMNKVGWASESTSFEYDGLGRQIKRQAVNGVVTEYRYDAQGHKTWEHVAGKSNDLSWKYDEQGRLISHQDRGNHVTTYDYNVNGLLLKETSLTGKNTRYTYQGDGLLIEYADFGHNERIEYTYDVEGQVRSKESSQNNTNVNSGWLRETDYYEYDVLGRLVRIRRRDPADVDHRLPAEGNELLAVDYEYDAVGNIRHTKARARYPHQQMVQRDEYYLYDENNRMTLNKGQLINGNIQMTAAQGNSMGYDKAGNVTHAEVYENGYLQNYDYEYTTENQLSWVIKNKRNVQHKTYVGDKVAVEERYDETGNIAQTNTMTYRQGALWTQHTKDVNHQLDTYTSYGYDDERNLTSLVIDTHGKKEEDSSRITHIYTYEYWDSAQQKEDSATHEAHGCKTTYGKSIRNYDPQNGLLSSTEDQSADPNGKSNSNLYLNSSLEGVRGRKDRDGTLGYLTVAGRTIGDFTLDKLGNQILNIYSGFTPTGSQEALSDEKRKPFDKLQKLLKLDNLFRRAPGDNANGVIPEAPQDSLSSYTLQVGDTLESVARQVYGDSSLWYLIADANGLIDRGAVAGDKGFMRAGLNLIIPPTTTGQHHTNATHKVLGANQFIGDTSATSAIPQPKPPKPKHHSIWSKVLVAVVATVATVLTAGALGVAVGLTANSLGALISVGTTVLEGGLVSLSTTMAIGFTAGFVGSIVSQGVANALGMQKGLDVTGSLISGLATAATAGIAHSLQHVKGLTDIVDKLTEKSLTNFNLATAAEMMEQNAASQGINVALRKHQHFDWVNLGVSGVTGGLLGGAAGRNLSRQIKKIDPTGIVRSELQSLAGASAESAVNGSHFNAGQVLGDNLGNAMGNALTSGLASPDYMSEYRKTLDDLSIDGLLKDYDTAKQDFDNFRARQLDEQNSYATVQTYGGYNRDYCPIPDGFYEEKAREVASQKEKELSENSRGGFWGLIDRAANSKAVTLINEIGDSMNPVIQVPKDINKAISDFRSGNIVSGLAMTGVTVFDLLGFSPGKNISVGVGRYGTALFSRLGSIGRKTAAAEKIEANIAHSRAGIESSNFLEFSRKAKARDFYAKGGWEADRISSHLDGIDFTKDIRIEVIPKGTKLQQHQMPHESIGHYFANPGADRTQLGIYTSGRTTRNYVSTSDVRALKSTTANITDRWSMPNYKWDIHLKGGETQYFTHNKLDWRIVP